ncbi:23641_t:CDS:2, partial [Dentiscutata erythropus]
ETSSDAVVALSRLSRLRRELRPLNASEKIISATLNPEVTRLSNKVQKEHSEQRENEGIDFPDHFSLESVKKRLDEYDVSNIPDKQALADIMIMLCIHPAEIKNLRISNGAVTGYAKNRGQQDISRVFRSLEKNREWAKQLLTWIQDNICFGQLKDPGKLESTYLSTFLKKDEFIPESGEPLLPSSLCKLGAVFASVAHRPKNASKASTYASEALRHSPDNHTSPSKRYTIVNMWKRGEPYNQARPFYKQNAKVYSVLSKEIKALDKKLDDYHSEETVVNCIKSFSASTILRLGVDDIDYVKAK